MNNEIKTSVRAFNLGVCWTCARLIEVFDQPTMALHLLAEAGIDKAIVRKCDAADRKPLLDAMKVEKEGS